MRGSVTWAWFLAWLAIGGCLALGVVSLGPLVVLPVAALGVATALRWPQSRRSLFGLVSGGGILLLVVAYLNRQGPGTTCWHTATAGGCDQHLNPLPWLVVRALFLFGGVVAQLRSG
jgi:hypothetical protein